MPHNSYKNYIHTNVNYTVLCYFAWKPTGPSWIRGFYEPGFDPKMPGFKKMRPDTSSLGWIRSKEPGCLDPVFLVTKGGINFLSIYIKHMGKKKDIIRLGSTIVC